eukprot:gb/GECG01013252.1/.p1 GENE.gb/GECG01013252.1/~~gb/GECG01013252.1/.p1  ORF type:complete len:716 (+),score=94.24 gb/GECG01013252.1/:1-2148(+)
MDSPSRRRLYEKRGTKLALRAGTAASPSQRRRHRQKVQHLKKRQVVQHGSNVPISGSFNKHTLSQYLEQIWEEEEPEPSSTIEEVYEDIPLSTSTDGGVFASHGEWHYPDDPQLASHIPKWSTPKTKAKKWKKCNDTEDVAKDLQNLDLKDRDDESTVYFDSLNQKDDSKGKEPVSSASEADVREAANLEPEASPRNEHVNSAIKTPQFSPRTPHLSQRAVTSILVSSVFEVLNLDEECGEDDDNEEQAEDELDEYLDPMATTVKDKKSSYKDFLFTELHKHATQGMVTWSPANGSELNFEQGALAWASCASDPVETSISSSSYAADGAISSTLPESSAVTSTAFVNSPPITSFAVPYTTPEPFRLDESLAPETNAVPTRNNESAEQTDGSTNQQDDDCPSEDAHSTVASTTAGGWIPSAEFWGVFGRRVLSKWVWECLEDNPQQESYRQKLLAASIQHLPGTRMWIAKALAEVSCDHLETFLRDLKLRREGGSWTAEVEAARAARSGCRRILGPVEDGSVLAELLCYLVNVVTEACSSLKPDAPPQMATWLTAQLELCARTVVNLCRTRPILDTYFNQLNGCICRMLPVRPHLAILLLKRFLAAWPTRDGLREVSWLKLTQTVLLSCPAPVICGSDVRMPLFKRIVCCLKSDHAAVAKTALGLTANMYLLLHYILPFPDISKSVNSALVHNRDHWNQDIREMSEEQFDQMLDYQ